MTRIHSQIAVVTFSLALLASLAAGALELIIPGGSVKFTGKPQPVTFPAKGGVQISPEMKKLLKDQSKPLYAYLEGVEMSDAAVDVQVFLHDAAAEGIDFHNYVASVGNVATGHGSHEKFQIVFDVRDFIAKDKAGKVLAEGKSRSHLADDKVKAVSLTLYCKAGELKFERLRITDKELE